MNSKLVSQSPEVPGGARPLETCPICGAKVRLWRTKAGSHESFTIDRCQSGCGFAFVNPRPTMEELRRYYATSGHGEQTEGVTVDNVLERERAYPNSTVDALRLVGNMKRLRPKAQALLDVGSGHGFFSREALHRGLDVTALERAEFERMCTRQVAGVEPVPVMFEDYESPDESFDLILMSQVLEHAFDVNQWVSRAAALLRSGGLLVVALPNFNSIFRLLLAEKDPYITPPAHLNFFGPESLKALGRRHGLDPLFLECTSRVPPDLASRRLRLDGAARDTVNIVATLAFNVLQSMIDPLMFGMMLSGYFEKRRT